MLARWMRHRNSFASSLRARHLSGVRSLVLAVGPLTFAACVVGDKPVVIGGTAVSDAVCAATEYRERREALNFCEVDDDCVEIEPEPCLTSYYANAATASESLDAVERELAARCGATEPQRCERQWLGPPRCRRGRCVPGELDRSVRGQCASTRVRLFELDRPELLFTHSGYPPPVGAPLTGLVHVDEPGTMTLRVEPGACVPYDLLLDHPPTWWSRSVPPSTGAQTLTYEVEPGEYGLRIFGPEVSCPLSITVTLQRSDGSRVPARYHGLLYALDCE
ncbi:MAG: hypothetical protein R6X02_30950 [Enhygromyxa sp.]